VGHPALGDISYFVTKIYNLPVENGSNSQGRLKWSRGGSKIPGVLEPLVPPLPMPICL